MREVKLKHGIFLLPSLLTTGSLFCAFFSIIRSINHDYTMAAWSILFASVFDMTDGRIARLTRTQSDFGKEYDSLVDLSSFGLAPAILAYTSTLSQFKPIGWTLSFVYFACAALRLARFNVQTTVVEKKRFNGLPTPPAACLIASFVLFQQAIVKHFSFPVSLQSTITLVMVPALAVLMVSNVSYQSFKELNVKKNNAFYVLIAVAVGLGIIASNPNIVLFFAFLIYILSGPLLGASRLLKRQPRSRVKHHPRKHHVSPKREQEEQKRITDEQQYH